jgi:subtilisin family serine protease
MNRSTKIGSCVASLAFAGALTVFLTSAAAPFVASVACLYLSANPSATPAQVEQWIKDNATQNAVTGTFPGEYNTTTPRRFLFTDQ